jgi:hypothetical protein
MRPPDYQGAGWIGFDPDALIDTLRIANAIGNAAAQSSAMAQNARAERAIERTGHQRKDGGHRTDGDGAVDRLGCRSQCPRDYHRQHQHAGKVQQGECQTMQRFHEHHRRGQAVTAVRIQRIIPALAASAAAPAGPSHLSSVGPATTKTTTSARTPSDHKSPAVLGPMPPPVEIHEASRKYRAIARFPRQHRRSRNYDHWSR